MVLMFPENRFKRNKPCDMLSLVTVIGESNSRCMAFAGRSETLELGLGLQLPMATTVKTYPLLEDPIYDGCVISLSDFSPRIHRVSTNPR